jgi:glycine/D-amino acid oxidase-like deaminating enzyme
MSGRRGHVDMVVVGLGLAGAALAWEAHAAGLDVVIIDDDDPAVASRVAAGLVTPVTGRKLKPQDNFPELLTTAVRHYRRVSELTGVKAYTERPAIRLLSTEKELAALPALGSSGGELIEPCNAERPAGVRDIGLPVVMPLAGRLAIADYVEATRRYFAARGVLVDGVIADDLVVPGDDGVEVPSIGVAARHIVFCRGYRDAQNAFFPEVRWRAAKGQILELDCEGFDPRYTVHGAGIWLTAHRKDRILAGATYEWDVLDASVTEDARDRLLEAVRTVLGLPVRVTGQRAAVRPIVEGRKPVAGHSRQSSRVWLLNGLGSKGTLFAPLLAESLVACIEGGRPISPAYCLRGRFESAA